MFKYIIIILSALIIGCGKTHHYVHYDPQRIEGEIVITGNIPIVIPDDLPVTYNIF